MDAFLRELRYSVRGLLRIPVLAATIVITVGLGIGATTAIYCVIHCVLLRDLPYPNAHELYRVYTDSRPNQRPLSVADYVALKEQKTQSQSVAGYVNTARTFTKKARPRLCAAGM